MTGRLAPAALVGLIALGPAAGPARAEAPPGQPPSILDGYLELLARERLLSPPAQSIEELRQILQRAQEHIMDGRKDEATALLVEALDGPRFRGFEEFDELHTAALLAAGLLLEQHALVSAQRMTDRVLAQGPERPAFGPGFRRAVDIALARGDLERSIQHLTEQVAGALPQDAQNELRYLKALAAQDRGQDAEAARALKAITERSRFYASAQYLLGALAAKQGRYDDAEARFCRVATAGKDAPFSFYIDGRFFPVRDLAYLGLGRVAHETARSEDAFYYYFQVPNDSERVSEALFEAAWASYEGQDFDAALDSLDQLEARFPRSAFAAEAGVLRGYVHLARCEFGQAEKHLVAFVRRFQPVLAEIDESLRSPSHRRGLYRELVSHQASSQTQSPAGAATSGSLLLSLLIADPDFYRLHAELRALNAELARSGNVPAELALLRARALGKDAPKAHLGDDPARADPARLLAEVADTEAALARFGAELRTLRAAGADRDSLAALSQTRATLTQRLAALQHDLRGALREPAPAPEEPSAGELATRFEQDAAYVSALRQSALRLRVALEQAADQAGERALRDLRRRLAKELRRARIGRIDAVMGSKRQVELQVESLAAGRFPPELTDPLRMQTLLRDDEEYWPFEGEDWPDEFLERYPEEP